MATPENEKFTALWPSYEQKMTADGMNSAAQNAFKYNFKVLTSGADLMIPESSIEPVDSLPDYAALTAENPALLESCVMVKLNGGLGTGMGLEKAKSLLDLKEGKTFLDFIALQVEQMRDVYKKPLAFMLMNSFATSADTLEYLAKYPTLQSEGLPLEFQQNKAPKITKDDLTPASWPAKPDCEWCPPGHGDLYPAMVGTGTLDALLAKGYKYMFVSNSDNLGATMDLKLLTWFAASGSPFAMECAERTDADKKGGHLAKAKGGGLLLREAAQCPDADEKEFQNVGKYKFFNTNNLWVNLEAAMGSANSAFPTAAEILIPRTRFAPVKTTADMLALMSDAYEITADLRMVLKEECKGVPPTIKLDDAYKFVDQLKKLVPGAPPSLVRCKKLTVEGANIEIEEGVVIEGSVKITNASGEPKKLTAGTYSSDVAL